MNRYLLLIVYALVGIFVSSCAPIPHYVVPKPAYGSHSDAPHHLPVHRSPRRAAGVVLLQGLAEVGGALRTLRVNRVTWNVMPLRLLLSNLGE
jgi:hypothetical protein